jgi:DMSO/TMAO reductase YedYZ molybdopterin-dependent catalytic subunit
VKLGLKNIKAITRITYTKDEPADYWAKRGYSRYDGFEPLSWDVCGVDNEQSGQIADVIAARLKVS